MEPDCKDSLCLTVEVKWQPECYGTCRGDSGRFVARAPGPLSSAFKRVCLLEVVCVVLVTRFD